MKETSFATLYFYCQECGEEWTCKLPLTDLDDIDTIYENICPRCLEPLAGSTAGIYRIVINDDFALPLYHGPIV